MIFCDKAQRGLVKGLKIREVLFKTQVAWIWSLADKGDLVDRILLIYFSGQARKINCSAQREQKRHFRVISSAPDLPEAISCWVTISLPNPVPSVSMALVEIDGYLVTQR